MFEELGRNKGVVDGFDNLRLSFGLFSFPFSRYTRVDLLLEVATLARISDTICTPLFLAKDPEDEVLRIEDVRVAGGRMRLRADGRRHQRLRG